MTWEMEARECVSNFPVAPGTLWCRYYDLSSVVLKSLQMVTVLRDPFVARGQQWTCLRAGFACRC